MDLDKTVRALVVREVTPLLAGCEQMRARIDRAEGALPILLDKRARAAARITVMMRRAELECLVAGLRGVEDCVVRLAKERWPQWRM